MVWIATDPDRPKLLHLLPPLILITVSPVFAALSFILLPAAILQSTPPGFVLDAFRVFEPSATSAALASLWTGTVIVAAPLLFLIHAALNYVGRRRVLQLSMQFQRALTKRVTAQFTEDGASIGERSALSAETARKLMLADARYLGRAFLSLASALPSLATTVMSLAILAWLVPWILLILLVVMLLFFPVQGYVAAQGQDYSDGYLAAGAKYGSFLNRSLRAFLMLPFPKRLQTESFGEAVTGPESEGFFANFEGRTRIGYFGDLWREIAVAFMLLALLLALNSFPRLHGEMTAEMAILVLVAARYFFAGTRSTLQTVVGLGNTYPYYRGYMSAIVRPTKHVGETDNSSANLEGLGAGSAKAAKRRALKLAAGELVGIVDEDGHNPWRTIDELQIDFRGTDRLDLSLTDDMILWAASDPEHQRATVVSRKIDYARVHEGYPESLRALASPERILAVIRDMDDGRGEQSPTESLIAAVAMALASEDVRVVFVSLRTLRHVKEAHRKQICASLNRAGIAVLIVSDDGGEFVVPKPGRYIAMSNEPDRPGVYVSETKLEDANRRAGGASVDRLTLRKGEYWGILAEHSRANWRAVRGVLSKLTADDAAEVVLVVPLEAGTFRRYLQLAQISPDKLAASLAKDHPGLRAWWSRIADLGPLDAGSSAAGAVLPAVEEFRLGLAYALSRNPDAVVIPAPVFSELAAEDRMLLRTALRDLNKTLLLWNDNGGPFEEPLPSRVVHISPQQRYRSIPNASGELPRLLRSANTSENVEFRLPNGLHKAKISGQIGVVANQPTMSWNEVGHFLRIGRKASDLFSRPATIVAPALLTNPAAFSLLREDAASVDLSGLTASYPGLRREWWSLLPYLEAMRKGLPDLELLLSDASAATHFWLALAFALNGDAQLIFVRERDLRLIPQNARARLVASMVSEKLVVWKDNLSVSFVLPQPDTVLLASNSRIISVAGPKVLWQDLDAETRRAVFRDSFAPPATDPTVVLAEEGA